MTRRATYIGSTRRQAPQAPAPVILGLGALAAVLGGCAGSYRLDERAPPDQPAADVLQLQWHRRLARHEIFDWRPQEYASAALATDGTMFVGSTGRRMVALDRRGKQLWSVRTEGAVSSRPLYHPGSSSVYFGADDGKIYAVDARSGKVRWRYATQGTIIHPPCYWEGLVLVTTSEDRIYAIQAADGRWRWQYDREAPEGFTIRGYAGVLVAGGVAYTGFSDGVVVALRPNAGEVIWTRNISGNKTRFVDVDATPVMVGDSLVTASYANGVHALDPESGSVRWQFAIEGASMVTARNGRIYFTAPQAGLIALDKLGRQIWRQAMPEGVPSAPVVVGRYVLVTGTDSGLFVAEAASGQLLQYFDPGHGISGAPAVGSGMVVVLSNHGRLFTFSLR